MKEDPGSDSKFDEFAGDYDGALAQGLSVSGEDKEYFCRGRLAWLDNCLRGLAFQPETVLDFGCGTGSATPYFFELLRAGTVLGVDPSVRSIEAATKLHGSARAQFAPASGFRAAGQTDLAFCNGVFHHIPPASRPDAVQLINRSLRSGGYFAFWENNPWNPGTRYVMSRIPFDRGAITLSVLEAARLLRAGGFEIVRADFLFIFPKALKWLRFAEPLAAKLPLGAQYQLLCRKR